MKVIITKDSMNANEILNKETKLLLLQILKQGFVTPLQVDSKRL